MADHARKQLLPSVPAVVNAMFPGTHSPGDAAALRCFAELAFLRVLAWKRAFFWRFPHVFMSHHLRVRLWLVSKKAAWQVGDAHKANFPSRSPAMMLIASAAITPRASSTQEAELSRHRRLLSGVRIAAARP